MKEYIEKSVVERMLWAVIMSKDERTIEEMLEDAPTVHAISVPEGATNGDMIGAVFPDKSTFNGGEGVYFKKEWWNAQFRKEAE